MPTGILLNEEGFRWSECSLADDVVAKMSSMKKFLVSSLSFEFPPFQRRNRVGPQLETRNLKLET